MPATWRECLRFQISLPVHTSSCGISRFSPLIDQIFQGKHLIYFLVLKVKDFWNFVLHNCILVFDAKQVYLKLQVTNLKNKEVTVNPKPQTLEKIGFSKTLYPKP